MTAKLIDHTLIYGFGRNGFQAGLCLIKNKYTFVAIKKTDFNLSIRQTHNIHCRPMPERTKFWSL